MLEATELASEKLRQLGDEGKKYSGIGASGDVSLVGDRISEESIINYLKDSLDSFVIVSEEKGFLKVGKGEKQKYFIIDPIDGSNNYRIGLSPYTISIAVSSSRFMNDIYSGIVYDISTGRYFWAEKNNGAYFLKKRIYTCKYEKKPYVISINFSNSEAGRLASSLKEYLKNNIKIRSLGSASWEACLVANNVLDAFIEAWNHLRVIDIAAASIILKESNTSFRFSLKEKDKNLEISFDKRISLLSFTSQKLMQIILSLL